MEKNCRIRRREGGLDLNDNALLAQYRNEHCNKEQNPIKQLGYTEMRV
jgi:hypothetical protein